MYIELINFDEEYGSLQEVTEANIVFRGRFHEKGLFSEQIFGPVDDFKCQCGRYTGKEYINKVCENCKVLVNTSSVRLTTFAKIAIPEYCCVVNPIVLNMLLKYHLPAKFNKINIDKIVQGKEYAIINDDSIKIIPKTTDGAKTGPLFFKEEIYPILLQDEDVSAFDTTYGELLFIRTIPVIPPDVRPLCMSESGRAIYQEDINESYIKILRTLQSTKKAPFVFDNVHVVLQRQFEELIKTLMAKYEHKTGFLRSHVLGKRIDYSGRAVIVVDGSEMPLGWCKIPYKIAKEVYKPQIIPLIAEKLKISTLKVLDDYEMPYLHEHILSILRSRFIGTFVFLNRQPTLHRPGIQSMKIYDVIEDDVIVVHPLVCEGFNADFDGDQMAIYIPHTLALEDARTKMWVDSNYRKPSNGEILFKFSQDMILGLNIVSTDTRGPTVYLGKPTYISRVELFKEVIPEKYHNDVNLFNLFDVVLDKKSVAILIDELEVKLTKQDWLKCVDALCRSGFRHSNNATLSLKDFMFDESYKDRLPELPDNHVTRVIRSGARGSWDNLRQISFEKGFISDVTGRVLPSPIQTNLLQGLSTKDYFTSCYGGRKGLVDTADNTAKSGYLTRKLVYLLLSTILNTSMSSCRIEKENKNTFSLYVRDEQIAKMLIKRYTADGVITKNNYKDIVGKTIELYSPITCSCENGICRHCYGDLYDIHKSKMVGIIAAQSVGERGTQLTLRTKHTSGSTDNVFKELTQYLDVQDGIIIAKQAGYVYIDTDSIIFGFNEEEHVLTGFETFDLTEDVTEVKEEDKTIYTFEENDEIAIVTLASQDVVSAITILSSLLSRPEPNISIQDYLYSLVDIFGTFASVDLVHFELIVSILCRSAVDPKLPYRLKPESDYVIMGLQKVIELMPEQALAFERFSKNIMNYLNNGFIEAKEAKMSFLRSLLFFEFNEKHVPEKRGW